MTPKESVAVHPAPMELLAPAGSLQAFEAALQEGADAVYIGAPGLNARALARDFTFAEIAAMAGYAHGKGKKIYVAMNSLMKEDEVRLALETLSLLAQIGPDGLIIQDHGVRHLAQRFFPKLPIHASTLMTVNNSMAARYFKEIGFARVVLARELSLEEIRTIHQQSTVELEIFIHGAMCFSYSGLCRFSSLHGGKSSLRGQCVQPCRRRYDWLSSGKRTAAHAGKSGGYLFSMNDLSGIDYLREAGAAGVVSLKIEGRLKSVAYVRNTVRAYRLALDALKAAPEQRPAMLAEAGQCLDAAMGRRRSSGFFIAGQEDRLIIPRLSGSSGEVIGKIIRVEEARGKKGATPTGLQVALQAAVSQGDRLRLYDERSGDRKSFTLHGLEINGRKVDQAQAGQTVMIRLAGMELGSLRQPIQGILFRVDVSSRTDRQKSALVRSVAHVRPPAPDPSRIDSLLTALAMGPEKKKPGSGLPQSSQRRPSRGAREKEVTGAPEWWVKVPSLEVLGQRYPFKVAKVLVDINQRNLEQYRLSLQKKRPQRLSLVWALPPVLREEQLAWYQESIEQLRQQGATRFQIGHLGQIALFRGEGQSLPREGLELYGDYACNVLNSPALHEWAARGLSGVQFSVETDRQTLAAALAHFSGSVRAQGKGRMKVGLFVHGRPPLFTARLDAPHFQGHRVFSSSRGERFYLERRDEALYALPQKPFSLLLYTGELSKMGVDYCVVDLSQGQLKKECAEVTALLSGRGELPEIFSGNYSGTLS
jgi:putative protease